MIKLSAFARVELVLVATNVWVVVLPEFIVGLAELAVTVTATVGPGPPCGGAPGVAVFRTGVVMFKATAVPAAVVALPVKTAVALIAFVLICTRKFTFTEAPAANVPMAQVTLIEDTVVQVPSPGWPSRTAAPSVVTRL